MRKQREVLDFCRVIDFYSHRRIFRIVTELPFGSGLFKPCSNWMPSIDIKKKFIPFICNNQSFHFYSSTSRWNLDNKKYVLLGICSKYPYIPKIYIEMR